MWKDKNSTYGSIYVLHRSKANVNIENWIVVYCALVLFIHVVELKLLVHLLTENCSYIQLRARELVFGGWRWLNLLYIEEVSVKEISTDKSNHEGNCNPALAPLHACRMVSGAFSTELKRYSFCYTVGKWILSRFWCPLFEKAPFHPPFPEIFVPTFWIIFSLLSKFIY